MKPFPRQRSMVASATSAIDFLQRHDAAAGLLPTAQRLLKLRRDVLALMPAALREICEVTGFDDDTVVLHVSSAGAAAKLRQTLPRIRDGLLDRGWKVNAIRMRVQPKTYSDISTTWRAPSTASIPAGALDAFAELSASLEHPALKSAVERLLRRRSRIA
jgi:hypothetical protein